MGGIYRKASAILIWHCIEEVDTDKKVAMDLLTNLSRASEDWAESDAGTAVKLRRVRR
jgi:predicted metal-dependent hydrolase